MKYNQLRLVMTGSSCNLRCAYCIAGYSDPDRHKITDEINEAKLLAAIGSNTFSSISLWGGEPFYNFAKLQTTVEFCKNNYPSLPILIVSNGTAFSREKIDFIKKHDLHITLSHDAINQHYRGIDYLQQPQYLELIKEIDDIAFTTVIHNFNCDIPAIFNYFEQVAETLQRDVYWGFELFQLSSPSAVKFLPHGKSLIEFAKSLEFMLEKFVQGHPFSYSALYRILNSMATIIDNDKTVPTRCGACNRLTVTTEGENAFCQVQAENGNIVHPDLNLPKMCNSCDVARFCTGICPHITEGYRKKLCIIYKLFYAKMRDFLVNLPQGIA